VNTETTPVITEAASNGVTSKQANPNVPRSAEEITAVALTGTDKETLFQRRPVRCRASSWPLRLISLAIACRAASLLEARNAFSMAW